MNHDAQTIQQQRRKDNDTQEKGSVGQVNSESQGRAETKEERLKAMIGLTFGRWTVIGVAPDRITKSGSSSHVFCRCDCGTERSINATSLRVKNSTSCGCFSSEINTARMTIHGHASKGQESPEFRSWLCMMQRCFNTKSDRYHYYGARGITVCDRWKTFVNFLSDMGSRPTGLTLERTDNNGNYEPGNVVWASHKQQARNTRSNRTLSFKGETKTVAEWAEITGVSASALYARVEMGWSDQDVITRPIRITKFNQHRYESTRKLQ